MNLKNIIAGLNIWFYSRYYLGSNTSSQLAEQIIAYFNDKDNPLCYMIDANRQEKLIYEVYQNVFNIMRSENPLLENT